MKKQDRLFRVVTFLKREELEFLDEITNDIYFTYGVKVPRARLIEEIIGELQDKGVAGKNELISRILTKMQPKVERRKFPRLKKNLEVGFRKLDSLEDYKNGVTSNISMGGVKIEILSLTKPPSANQVVELSIKDPEEALEPIKAMGRVAWIKEKENHEGTELGIMLTYIRKEDRQRFQQFLSHEKEVKAESKLNEKK